MGLVGVAHYMIHEKIEKMKMLKDHQILEEGVLVVVMAMTMTVVRMLMMLNVH